VVLTSLSDGERRVVVPDGGAGVGCPDSGVAGTRRSVLHQGAGKGENKKIKSDRHMNEEKSKIFADEIDQRQHLVGIHGFSCLTWGKKQCVVDGGAAIRKKRRLICLSLAFLAFIVSNEEEGRICPSCNWNIIVRTERAHLHGHYFEVCALSYVFKLLSLIFLLCLTIIFIYFLKLLYSLL
jgi:hypothetical protein